MDARIHPWTVHFAFGLILASVALFFVGTLGARREWAAGVLAAARWNLWLGAACALASIGTGFVDYQGALCDRDAIAATVLHRRSGAVTWWSSLIAAIAVYRTRHRSPGPALLAWLLLVATAASTATWLGTRLTYDRGLGVAGTAAEGTAACFELERG